MPLSLSSVVVVTFAPGYPPPTNIVADVTVSEDSGCWPLIKPDLANGYIN
jgi:hypothetical protein